MELSPEAQELRKEQHREYMRAWRAKNPDKVKANMIAYWERKLQKVHEEMSQTNENK